MKTKVTKTLLWGCGDSFPLNELIFTSTKIKRDYYDATVRKLCLWIKHDCFFSFCSLACSQMLLNSLMSDFSKINESSQWEQLASVCVCCCRNLSNTFPSHTHVYVHTHTNHLLFMLPAVSNHIFVDYTSTEAWYTLWIKKGGACSRNSTWCCCLYCTCFELVG